MTHAGKKCDLENNKNPKCDKQNKKHPQQISGIEMRLTIDTCTNIDPQPFQFSTFKKSRLVFNWCFNQQKWGPDSRNWN